jgi:hypothetical protein
VTICPGPVSDPGGFTSCGYLSGTLVGPVGALAQALTLPAISVPQWERSGAISNVIRTRSTIAHERRFRHSGWTSAFTPTANERREVLCSVTHAPAFAIACRTQPAPPIHGLWEMRLNRLTVEKNGTAGPYSVGSASGQEPAAQPPYRSVRYGGRGCDVEYFLSPGRLRRQTAGRGACAQAGGMAKRAICV